MQHRIAPADLEHIASSLNDVLPSIANRRIFITGGTGFFGKWLLEALLWANEHYNTNCSIVVLTRNAEKFIASYPQFNNQYISFHQGDIKDFPYPEGEFHYCIHAALEGEQLNNTDELEIFNAAYKGTSHVLAFAKQKQVVSTLYISSGGVYGRQPRDLALVPETYAGAPDTTQLAACYGEGKRTGEFLCTYYGRQYDMQIKIARCFAFAGAYLPLEAHFVFGNFISNCLAGAPIIIKGDGTTIRSYMYAGDLVVALLKTLVHGDNLLPYNIGSNQPVSIIELAEKISGQFSPRPAITVLGKKVEGALPDRYIPDTERFTTRFPFQQLDLDETIRRTVDFYKPR